MFPAIVVYNGSLVDKISSSGSLPKYNNRQSGDNCRQFHMSRFQRNF